MGWASGSSLAEKVWVVVRPFVPTEDRREVARHIIDCFEDEDCDTMDEATTLWKDAKPVREEHPSRCVVHFVKDSFKDRFSED